MRKLLLLALLGGFLAGAFFAFRWFRGDTLYEEALRALDEEEAAAQQEAGAENAAAQPGQTGE
jgi:hypothetical protein